MEVDRRLRVAIIGARGIGKHHAKWWNLCGAEVCGILGTSEASVARTTQTLMDMFGVSCRGYTDMNALLAQEKPDYVDVCSPPGFHYEHVRAALEVDCDVLCEKPFVFEWGTERSLVLAKASELVDLAERRGRVLSICTQYSVGADMLLDLWREQHGNVPITHFRGRLETPAKNRPPNPARVWTDLGPHMISVAQRIAPDGAADWTTLEAVFSNYEAAARFRVNRPGAPDLDCEIVTRNTTRSPGHVRELWFNNTRYRIGGENDEEGIYRTLIVGPEKTVRRPDFMHALIQACFERRPPVTLREALVNTDWLLRILETAVHA